jgi:hypothetical protein
MAKIPTLILVLLLAACASTSADRGRGGGPIIVTSMGARGDGVQLDTAAIQAAIDTAAAGGGGRVMVPAGTYKVGTIALRSRVHLELAPGATLRASPDLNDYVAQATSQQGDRHPFHLLVADRVSHVTVSGGGTIDGNGPAFWRPQARPGAWIVAKDRRPSPLIEVRDSQDVRFQDIQIVNSPGWTVHLFRCDRVWIRGIRILNHLLGPNTDGIDINGSRDVLISDAIIEAGDDAIVIKTTKDSRSAERIAVTNSVLRTNCAAFKLGTESFHDFRYITFSQSVVHASNRIFAIYVLDGGTAEHVTVSDVVGDTNTTVSMSRPVHLDLRRRTDESKLGKIRHVRVSGMSLRTDGRLLMTSEDGGSIDDVTLRDLTLSYPMIDDPYPRAAKTGSAQMSNRSPAARVARAAVVADNLSNLVIENLVVRWPGEAPPVSWERKPGPAAPFGVVWGRRLQGGRLDVASTQASAADTKRVQLEGSSGVVLRE